MDYNQNYQNNQINMDNQPTVEPQFNRFSVAALVCGIASITLCCTGVLSFALGALGILFVVLSKRHGKPMPPMSIAAVATSCTGIILGLVLLIYSIFLIFTDPEYREIYEDTFEYYNELYNYELEDL